MQKKFRLLFGAGGPYIVFALCLLAAGVLGWRFFVPSAAEPAETDPLPELRAEQPRLPETDLSAPGSDAGSVPAEVPAPQEDSVSVAGTAEIPAARPAAKPRTQSPALRAPLEGKTIAAFSAEVLAYNEALDDWRTHSGVDIAAEEGTPVCAACDGTVLSVTEDPLMGVTVVVEHEGGFTSTYACLGTEVYVSAGDAVLAGQSIGAVGTTAAGESAEPHLHFSIAKDGTLIDPAEYLS